VYRLDDYILQIVLAITVDGVDVIISKCHYSYYKYSPKLQRGCTAV
jgi:hypothetical protein